MMLVGIFVGGGLGSLLRYLISGMFNERFQGFPAGTVLVNLLGCFALGCLIGEQNMHGRSGELLRASLGTGLLGGFTTFSTFGVESIKLYQNGHFMYAALYILASLLGGFGAAAIGIRLST